MLPERLQSEKRDVKNRFFAPRTLLSRRKFFAALLTAPFAMAGHAIGIEPAWLRVKRIRLGAQPKHRFVHFTDIHHKGDTAFLERVVAKINDQKPDFVRSTGDLVEESEFVAEALAILQKSKRRFMASRAITISGQTSILTCRARRSRRRAGDG
jgi:hypothetical protein